MNVLVLDVGGTQVKLRASGCEDTRRFRSGKELTPHDLVTRVKEVTGDWSYDVVALGYPGSVDDNGPAAEPGNLGPGWVGYDFAKAFERPVRVVNDAVRTGLGAAEVHGKPSDARNGSSHYGCWLLRCAAARALINSRVVLGRFEGS